MSLTEEEIHNLPDFQELEAILQSYMEQCQSFSSLDDYLVFVDRIINHAALEHTALHRMDDLVAVTNTPAPIAHIFGHVFMGMWKDGFLTGVRMQQQRDLALLNGTAPDTVPDNLA